jgi:hypothetical protein
VDPEHCTDCDGALAEGGHCLAHATDAELDALAGRIEQGELLNARGVTVTAERLAELLERVGARFGGAVDFTEARFEDAGFSGARFECMAYFIRTEFVLADFRQAEFAAGVGFGGARFAESAWFDGAEFEQGADFGSARFGILASFARARIRGEVRFHHAEFATGPNCNEAEFVGEASFSTARFGGASSFGSTRFADRAHFVDTELGGDAHFLNARFESSCAFARARFAGDAVFRGAAFAERASFAEAEFRALVNLTDSRFEDDATFTGATFARPVAIGGFEVAGKLSFSQATFADDGALDVAASGIDLAGTRFAGRANLVVRAAEITLDYATFEQRSVLAGGRPRPRLMSIRRAAVANLALANLDLRGCRFVGAHDLDALHIEPDCEFADPPPGRRYTRRRTIAEEHHWRGWDSPETRPSEWLEALSPVDVLDPARIASLYRLLRKALEDHKDEPGAADFYYGEMDMRRHQPRDRGEAAVLTLYWLVSGYGLRALRALACLALTILAGALLLDWFGFRPDESFGRSLLFSLESSVSLLRAPETKLTAGGEVVQIVLRLAGPLFFALALLALRGRVKR